MKLFNKIVLVIAIGLGGILVYLMIQLNNPKFGLKMGNQGFGHFIHQDEETKLNKISENLYNFQWIHYTSMIVTSENGLIVIDPNNAQSAAKLKEVLNSNFPGKPVVAMLYSHFHKDHAEGGKVLDAKRIIGHKDIPLYLEDWPGHDVQLPNELIEGDTALVIDGVKVNCVYLPKGHTETMYAFHFPELEALYSADLATVGTMPFVLMDMYLPAIERNLIKMSKINFKHFVPSHFNYGTKEDLTNSLKMYQGFRQIARDAFEKYGPLSETSGYPMQSYMYDRLKAEYGNLHGFDDLYIPVITRLFLGELAGY